jgi:Putative prokaryotic signal transducing protein
MRQAPRLPLVAAGSFGSRIDAELAKALLAEEGIPAFVRADDAGGMRPSLQFTAGVALIVRAEDLPRARAVLEAAHA